MQWLERHKYLALLVSFLALILVYPALRVTLQTRLVFDLLVTLLFLAAAFVVFSGRHQRILATTLGLPAILLPWIGYLLPEFSAIPVAVAEHFVASLLLGFTVFTIVSSIYRAKSITAEGIFGTLCGYLLVGLAFGHAYCLLELTAPGSFRTDGEPLPPVERGGHTHFLLAYFSLITLTTVGYGDIVPISEAARGFAAVEAVLGQFYLAVLIADLVGKRVSQSSPGQSGEEKPG